MTRPWCTIPAAAHPAPPRPSSLPCPPIYGPPQLFKFKERSNCLMRQVCGPRREFNMAFFADTPRIASHRQGGEPLTYPDAIVLERPFKCTCVCFNRSVIRVKHNTLGYLGEVYNPWEWWVHTHCIMMMGAA